jgi:microcystin degradation protein MlrC
MAPRVLVTGVWHETNSFARTPTDLAAFEAYQLVRGAAMVDAFAGSNTEIGGMIAAAGAHDLGLIFGLFAGAVPSGLVTAGAFAALRDETCARAHAAGPLDGILVALHGAMVAEGEDDADAVLLAGLRAAVGPEVPLVATFDIHANLSPALFAAADVLIGYDTYPHTDMAERGAEATACLAGILASGRRPAKALRKLPLLTVPQVQATAESPLREVLAGLHALEAGPDVLTASLPVGFPYADVAQLGVAVVAYGDSLAAVDAAADRLADGVWSRRHEFLPALVPADEAVRRAMAAPHGPVVLVDVADNVGGGAPGDGTVLLAALLAAGAQDAVVVLWAPAAAGTCATLGPGARFHGEIGGSDGRHGTALTLAGTILRAGAVEYRRRSSYMTGQLVRLGEVVVLDAGGVRVVLTERRATPFDADHLRVLGIAPEAQQILVCKSAIGWRAAFGEIARAHLFVDTPGICASDLGQFAYSKGQDAMFPLDPAASWQQGDG